MKKNHPDEKLDPKLVRIALIMVLGMFAPALDATIVNVAIKTIITELNSSIAIAQWITTTYILVMGIAVPVVGWLDNRFSIKIIYILSLVIFFIGSVFASLSRYSCPDNTYFRAGIRWFSDKCVALVLDVLCKYSALYCGIFVCA